MFLPSAQRLRNFAERILAETRHCFGMAMTTREIVIVAKEQQYWVSDAATSWATLHAALSRDIQSNVHGSPRENEAEQGTRDAESIKTIDVVLLTHRLGNIVNFESNRRFVFGLPRTAPGYNTLQKVRLARQPDFVLTGFT